MQRIRAAEDSVKALTVKEAVLELDKAEVLAGQ